MTNLHTFPRYVTAENLVTNNTLILLNRIYLDSRKRFEELVLSVWDRGVEAPKFGLKFTQQERGAASVPDGVISQDSVKFVIETKLHDVFDVGQVRRHFDELSRAEHRFALLLGSGVINTASAEMTALQREADARGIALAAITFAELVERVRKLYERHHEEMVELIADYEAFCDSRDLLPQDEWTVFVPPCGQSLSHNLSERLYYCQSERSIRRTRYLGIYADKSVQAIGRIARVVENPVVDLDQRTLLPEPGTAAPTADETERILRACEAARALGWEIEEGHKFFLCDELAPTDFRKRTAGGIQNRRYLNLRHLLAPQAVPADLDQLAASLRSLTWE